METINCQKCGKTIVERDDNHNIVKARPNVQCAKCGNTFCTPCAQDKKSCPICGYEG